MNNIRLRFCPFCGGLPEMENVKLKWYERLAEGRVYDAQVRCKYCQTKTNRFISEEYAAMAWNRRSGT